MGQPRLDSQRLTAYLRALAVPNRIDLLRKLQVPCTVGELDLRPARTDRARSPDRPLAWRTVEGHVRTLEALGLVEAREARRDGRAVREYVVNHARLFLITEELRTLALLRPEPGAGRSRTGALDAEAEGPGPAERPRGPALVVPGGPMEGTVFPLAGPGPWVVGRARGLAVALPFDPFVSARNTEVRREGRGFAARDLGGRNGTRVDWRRLPKGGEAPLAGSDVLGVGRSALVFRER